MATPSYKGQALPVVNDGWLGGLGSWFGGVSTPAYAGKGQPSPASSGYLAGSTPAYKPAPAKPSLAPAATAASTAPATSEGACAMGIPPFAIVIPRDAIEP